MTLRDAAVERFGLGWVQALEASAGCHADGIEKSVPALGKEARLVYGLLEAVDYECPKYDWACPGRMEHEVVLVTASLEDLRQFLTEHRAEVLAAACKPPSFLGIMAGGFNFLDPDSEAAP